MRFTLVLVFSFFTVVLAEANGLTASAISTGPCHAENQIYIKDQSEKNLKALQDCRAEERAKELGKTCNEAYKEFSSAAKDSGFKKGCAAIGSQGGKDCVVKAENCKDAFEYDSDENEDRYTDCPAFASVDLDDVRDEYKTKKDEVDDLETKIEGFQDEQTTKKGEVGNLQAEIQDLKTEYEQKINDTVKAIYDANKEIADEIRSTSLEIQSKITEVSLDLRIMRARSPEYRQKLLEIRDNCFKLAYDNENVQVENERTRIRTGSNQVRGGFTTLARKSQEAPGGTAWRIRERTVSLFDSCYSEQQRLVEQDRQIKISQAERILESLYAQLNSLSAQMPQLQEIQREADEARSKLEREFQSKFAKLNTALQQAVQQMQMLQERMQKTAAKHHQENNELNRLLTKKRSAEKAKRGNTSESTLDDLLGGLGAYVSARESAESSCCADHMYWDPGKCKNLDLGTSSPSGKTRGPGGARR